MTESTNTPACGSTPRSGPAPSGPESPGNTPAPSGPESLGSGPAPSGPESPNSRPAPLTPPASPSTGQLGPAPRSPALEPIVVAAPLDEETESLLRDYQKALLRRALEAVSAPDFDARKDLAKHVAYFCNISRQANAARRTAARLEIANARNAAALQIAEIRAEAAVKAADARARRHKLPGELDDPELENIAAPHGRDDTGRPYTEEEFHAALSRSVKEIYGVDFDAAKVAQSAKPGYVYPTPAECKAREEERHRREREEERRRKEQEAEPRRNEKEDERPQMENDAEPRRTENEAERRRKEEEAERMGKGSHPALAPSEPRPSPSPGLRFRPNDWSKIW